MSREELAGMARQWMGCVALLAACAGASAQLGGGGPGTIDELLAKIGSDSFEERTAATEALAGATNIDANQLAQRVRSGELDPEITLRVLEVLHQRFVGAPRGAIGVRFDDSKAGAPLLVMQTYQNFPACRAEIVRPGDEFIEVDGKSLIGCADGAALATVQAAIFSRSPGESVKVKLRRPETPQLDANGVFVPGLPPVGEPTPMRILDVDVPLGRYDQLGTIQQIAQPAAGQPNNAPVIQEINVAARVLNDTVLANAWAAYMQRLGIANRDVPLSAGPGAQIPWKDVDADAVLGRPAFRPGGRILAGPVSANAGTIAGLRSSPDVMRNQEALRDIGVINGGAVQEIVVQRVGGADVIKLGDGVNRVEIQVVGRNVVGDQRVLRAIHGTRPNGTPLHPSVIDARLDGAREELAAELARVESEIRRLTSQRAGSSDDLSATRLVEERVAELRAEWESLRAQAAAVASGAAHNGAAQDPMD